MSSKEVTAIAYFYETLIDMYPTIKDVFDNSIIARGILQEAKEKEENQLEIMFDFGFDEGLDYEQNIAKHDEDDEAFSQTYFSDVFKRKFTTHYVIDETE